MKFSPLLATAALLGTLVAPTLAQSNDNTKVTTSPGKASAARTRTAVVTVTEVDASKGTLSIKDPKGNVSSLKVGPEVRNLAQVKVGDRITVRYQESLSLALKKEGKELPSATGSAAAAGAAPGQRPAGEAMETLEVTADVTAVDTKQQIITLRGPERTVQMRVPDPEQLKLIKVGDQVHAVYTQALALSVEPAPAAKK